MLNLYCTVDKNIGFVHFLSIATAIKVVTTLAAEPEWTGRRINYGPFNFC